MGIVSEQEHRGMAVQHGAVKVFEFRFLLPTYFTVGRHQEF